KGMVDETEVGRIAEGNQVKLIIGAMQDAQFDASLEYIAPKAVEENGAKTFEIKAAVKKTTPHALIRSGYSANGEVVTDRRDSVLSLPESVLEFIGDSVYVYVVNPMANKNKEKYNKKAVKIGLSDGINVEIIEGITLKDKVRGKAVVEGKDKKHN
ncbi:MAG: efflux transporter periplasmic adaptor subunit, partial [Bacteroidales bacterium]